MKTAYSETYRVSKTFDAPLEFVYAWCTDYRKDDPKMFSSKLRRVFHEKTKKRAIWTIAGEGLPSGIDPVRVVWLRPPDAWHLETCGDETLVGDYKLTALSSRRTRLDMAFTQTYGTRKEVRSREDFQRARRATLDHWNHYAKFLERDYRLSLRFRALRSRGGTFLTQ
jgi:hypothetical protein